MTIVEVVKPDPLRQQLDGIKRQQAALKQRKLRVKSQQAQQQLRAAQAPAKP
jgi:hypothetical protein